MTARPRKPPSPSAAIDQYCVPIDRITLEITKLQSRFAIDMGGLSRSIDIRSWQDEIAHRMIVDIKARCASKKFDSRVVSYPATWWQHFKRAWFPKWALRKWPVELESVSFEASAYYPSIQIPDHAAFVEIAMKAQQRYYEKDFR